MTHRVLGVDTLVGAALRLSTPQRAACSAHHASNRQRAFALQPVPLPLVADLAPRLLLQRLQQIEGDIRRLEMLQRPRA